MNWTTDTSSAAELPNPENLHEYMALDADGWVARVGMTKRGAGTVVIVSQRYDVNFAAIMPPKVYEDFKRDLFTLSEPDFVAKYDNKHQTGAIVFEGLRPDKIIAASASYTHLIASYGLGQYTFWEFTQI